MDIGLKIYAAASIAVIVLIATINMLFTANPSGFSHLSAKPSIRAPHPTDKSAPKCHAFAWTGNDRRPAVPKTPPWVDLLKDSSKALYIRAEHCARLRLGNQMSNYASLFGIAWRNRRIPVWPGGRTFVRDYFNIRAYIDDNKTVFGNVAASNFTLIREPGSAIYGNNTEQLPSSNVTVGVYLHSWKYYSHVEDQLRIDFTFKDNILGLAKHFIASSTPTAWRSISFSRVLLHVRRTDFARAIHVADGWPPVTVDYFRRAMAFFRSCLRRVQFVVISDDIAWCMINIRGPDVVFSRGSSAAVDMAIASLCDHAIISVGSFGMWTAWMANGVTVTLKGVPRPGSTLARRMHSEDFYRPGNIGM